MTRKTTSKTKAKTTKIQTPAAAPTTPILSALAEKASIEVKPVIDVKTATDVKPALDVKPMVTDAAPAPRQVTSRDIAVRAYELFCARQGRHGNPLQDWLQAERELARA